VKKVIVLILINAAMAFINVAKCQQYPYFSQYFLNPFLYNPAALGNSGYNEVNLTYRQQWLGINDAPTTQAFNFQYPTRKSLSFGINFYNDKAVLLNTSSLMFAIAYQANISEGHFVKFGLSTGIGFNNFDLDEVDNPNDPALANVLSQTSFLTGQFGVFYHVKGLKLGLSLPQLFKYSALDTTNFQEVSIDQLDNYIITASYNFNFGLSKVGLEPFAMYRKSEMLPSIIELGAMFDYNDHFWIGGSYRIDYGGTGYMGVNIRKNMSFAYAYEFAGGQQMNLGNGSHELNFKVRFGKSKHKKKAKILAQAQPATSSHTEPQVSFTAPVVLPSIIEKEPEEEIREAPLIGKKEEVKEVELRSSNPEEVTDLEIEEIDDDRDPNFNKPKPTFAPGYYVVLGAFEIYDNAISYSELLNSKGINVDYGYVEDRGLYYIFYIHTANEDEASRIQQQFKQIDDFKDSWVYEVIRYK
jgi:type IX secretion system PorP/SprF family membrane protein